MDQQEYQPRNYRHKFNTLRFKGFQMQYLDTDLWIGVDPVSFRKAMEETARDKVKELREKLDRYIDATPEFAKSLVPFHPEEAAPAEAGEMARTAAMAGIGPMASVAGLFSREAAKAIIQNFSVQELVIENGGDIFALLKDELVLSVYAGTSSLSEKTGLIIPPQTGELGICTSAGTVGPSLSFGNADAVTVVCRDALLADAFATALGNEVKSAGDIQHVLNRSEQFPEIIALVIVCEDKIGMRGKFELKLLT